MKSLIKNIVVPVLLTLVSAQSAIASTTQIALPESAETAWVSSNLNQSGLALSIRTFHSPEPVESVLEFYRNAWFKEGEVPGFIENDLLDWKLISQQHDKENVVLQLKTTAEGGSTGFLSIAQIYGAPQSKPHGFPLPDSTEEYATTYIKEDGADVHTMTFLTKQSVGNTASFYKDRLSRKGWSMARSDDVKGSKVMLFNRKDDRCELVIQQLNEVDTVIFVNRVKRDV